jgi:hypothetical protein
MMVVINIKDLITLVCISFFIICCGNANDDSKGPVIASIDGFELSLMEFETQLAEEQEFNPEYALTDGAKLEFLERIIRKELLIREAKNLKLDQEQRFIRTIERYWEATLIRDIIEVKNREFEKRAYITEAEVETALKEEYGSNPYSEKDKAKIMEGLKDNKKQALFIKWVETLRSQADVEINQKLMN